MIHKRYKTLMIVVMAIAIAVSTSISLEAGCKITIKVDNEKDYPITVNWKSSKVKIKGGIFKKIGTNSQSIPAAESKDHAFSAAFGCKKNRQYKIYWSGGGSDGWVYYPSASGFTKNTSFTVKVK